MNVITISKEPIMFNQDDIEIVAAYSPSDDIQKIIEDAEKLQADKFVIGDISEFGDDQQQFSILTQLQAHRGLIVSSAQSEYISIQMINNLNNIEIVALVSIFEYVMTDKDGMLHIFKIIVADNDLIVEEDIYSRDELKAFVQENLSVYDIRKYLPINSYLYNDRKHTEKLLRSLLAFTLVDGEETMRECLMKYINEGIVPEPNALKMIPFYEKSIKEMEEE